MKNGKSTFGSGDDTVVTGWIISGGEGGVYDPNDGEISNVTGENVAYLFDAGASLSQQLAGYTYNANEQVTVTLDIGDPNYEIAQDYTINIYAGATVIGSQSGNTGNLDALNTVTVSSTVQNVALNGEAITIEIVKTGQDDTELHIDNVQAEYTVVGQDGVVDGAQTGEVMGVGYADFAGDSISSGGDIISAKGGNDDVTADDGPDTIDGGAGDDTLRGELGDDVFVASEGSDSILGGLGTNTYDASGDAQSGYTPELQDEAINVTVGTQGTGGTNPAYGDGSISLSNSGGSATFEDLQIFIAGEDQAGPAGTNLLPGSPTLPADDADTDYYNVTLDGSEVDATAVTGGPDGADGKEGVFVAEDGGDIGDFKFRFQGGGGADDGGDGEEDILFFDLETFNDTFNLEIASENGTDFNPLQDKIIFTNALSRTDNPDGSVTVEYIGSDGGTYSITVAPDNAIVEVYGDQNPNDETDIITLEQAVLTTGVIGIDDNATGTFTPSGGGPVVNFGPGGTTISTLLSDPATAGGTYSITGGDESGTIGGIEFQNFEQINFTVACFTRGTVIAAAQGPTLIETLVPGDQVHTRDHGLQPLRWIGSKSVPALGAVAPILFKAGAVGNTQDLLVSPQHRMLVRGGIPELLFAEEEVLVPAKALVNGRDIIVHEGGEVEYFHLLFDTHEIVWANGAEAESFHPGVEGFGAMADAARQEILMLFPELDQRHQTTYGPTARPVLRAFEGRVLV